MTISNITERSQFTQVTDSVKDVSKKVAHRTAQSFADFAGASLQGLGHVTASAAQTVYEPVASTVMQHHRRINDAGRTILGASTAVVTAATTGLVADAFAESMLDAAERAGVEVTDEMREQASQATRLAGAAVGGLASVAYYGSLKRLGREAALTQDDPRVNELNQLGAPLIQQ